MDPLDFLRVANTLKDSAEEAELRTAVGRAYYAVFNHIRSYLASKNVRFENYRIHERLPMSIRNSGGEVAREVGSKFGELRDDRHESDYTMDKAEYEINTETCGMLVCKANQTIKDFDSCKCDELVDGVKAYMTSCCWPIL